MLTDGTPPTDRLCKSSALATAWLCGASPWPWSARSIRHSRPFATPTAAQTTSAEHANTRTDSIAGPSMAVRSLQTANSLTACCAPNAAWHPASLSTPSLALQTLARRAAQLHQSRGLRLQSAHLHHSWFRRCRPRSAPPCSPLQKALRTRMGVHEAVNLLREQPRLTPSGSLRSLKQWMQAAHGVRWRRCAYRQTYSGF